MVSHDHEEQAKSRPAEAALIADSQPSIFFALKFYMFRIRFFDIAFGETLVVSA